MEPDRPFYLRLLDWMSPVVYLSSNPISLTGVVLATIGAVSWFFLLPVLTHGTSQNPYLGILWLVILGVFIAGLILIPVGIYLRRLRLRKEEATAEPVFPPLTLRSPELRKLLTFVLVTTFANVVIAGQLTYSSINYMDTSRFCGQVCHTVMQPEFVAYSQSPHQRVECVECHIGPGASWFVQSKLSGLGQVVAVATNSYPRPIPSPVSNLRPARETCERCHWPQRFTGDKVVVHTEYAPDEHNTAATTVLLVKVGGRAWNGTVGIHGAHLADKATIEYITTDSKRQVIPQVIYTDAGRQANHLYLQRYEAHAAGVGPGEHRTMDCVDCHNRPTHVFQMPGKSFGRRPVQRQHQPYPPVREKAGPGRAAGELPGPRRRADADRRHARSVLPDQLSAGVLPTARTSGERDRISPGYLRPQYFSGDESDLGYLREQYRSHGFSRMLPLPRRQPRQR